jgi:hypothetical protein
LLLLGSVVGCGSSATRPDAGEGGAPDALGGVDVATADAGRDTGVDSSDAAPAATCGEPGRGNVWAAWPLPDPAGPRFDTSTPDVVIDPKTRLTWQRQASGSLLAWDDANTYCACLALAGHDDWRLPTRIELVTIVDPRRQDPSIDVAAFPDTPVTWFWSGSPVAGDDRVAWYLSFMDGNTHEGAREVTYGTRCVRGAAAARLPYQVSAGTVTDPGTRLTWQQTIDPTLRPWSGAQSYCASLPLAGGGWRLPSMAELQSLIDESRTDPAIDRAAFPDTPSEGFWAGTPLAGMPGAYWFVSFDRGIAYNAVEMHEYNVRCVR